MVIYCQQVIVFSLQLVEYKVIHGHQVKWCSGHGVKLIIRRIYVYSWSKDHGVKVAIRKIQGYS